MNNNSLQPRVSDESLEESTADCDVFRKSRRYDVKSAIETDMDFSIAFNLIVHKDADQVYYSYMLSSSDINIYGY